MAEFSERARQELRTNSQIAREAVVEGARQMAILWEARLNMALAAEDEESIRNVLGEAGAQRYMDNCNCGGGGGTAFLG